MQRLVLFPATSFVFVIFVIFLRPTRFALAQNDRQYQNCSATFVCGNITDIRYPFWGSNRPEYCGHPEFELNCTGQKAILTIQELTYQVLKIDIEARNLKVVRTDYIDGICPSHLVNTSLNSDYFSFDSDIQNIALYYGCTEPSLPLPATQGLSTEFTCNSTGNQGKVFYLTRDLGSFGNAIVNVVGTCNSVVIVPATRSAVQKLEIGGLSEENLVVALEQGFGLDWQANNTTCETCKLSNGLCGSNSTDSRLFTCYCTDGPHPFSCGGSSANPSASGWDGFLWATITSSTS